MKTAPTDLERGADQCANCAANFPAGTQYCPLCGQRVLPDHGRSFKHLFRSSVEEATSLDGRLWTSLRYLLFRPGYLSREYRLGRRARYVSPMGLFLLANLVFFLAPSLSDFNLSLSDQYRMQPYSAWIAPLVQPALDESQQITPALAQAYQMRANEIAKVMVVMHVPLLALISLLLGLDKRLYYADHVVAVLHFFAFLMLYYAALPHLIVPLLHLVVGLTPWEPPVWRIAVSVQFLYLPLMLRRAFEYPWWRVLPTTLVLLGSLYIVHSGYRLTQFLLAWVSMEWNVG